MQVITLVISNSEKTTSTELVYNEGSSKLASIPLNSCCMHIQGPGSQSEGINHAARVLGSNGNGGIWRAAITLRFSIGRIKQPNTFKKLLGEMLLRSEPPPPSEWICSYDKVGVIDQVTTYEIHNQAPVACEADSENDTSKHYGEDPRDRCSGVATEDNNVPQDLQQTTVLLGARRSNTVKTLQERTSFNFEVHCSIGQVASRGL